MIKKVILITGGIALLPYCSSDSERLSTAVKNLKIKTSDEELLVEIIETMLPPSDIPGATELGIHHFVLVMADDCMTKPEQDMFVKGLRGFGTYVKERFGKSFLKASQAEREEMVASVVATVGSGQEETKFFLERTKRLSIRGFMSSEYVMTKVLPYKLIPGPFRGCVPLDAANSKVS